MDFGEGWSEWDVRYATTQLVSPGSARQISVSEFDARPCLVNELSPGVGAFDTRSQSLRDRLRVPFWVRYSKTTEKPPFQTWQEIQRKISRNGLSEDGQKELWDYLFLTLPEIDQLLEHVEETAKHDFNIPMVA